MRASTATSLLYLSSFVLGSPISKRALSQDDVSVLQLAHYLELLEYALYSGGCNDFTDAQYSAAGFPTGFRENVCVIASQELIHADTLASILTANGQTPLPQCTYSFPYTDPVSFVSVSNMITTVGIGAYIGGGALLTDDPDLLTAASSILTVEARHDSYLRTGLGASPFPAPFDTALSAVWAFNLAQAFIVSCPQQPPLIQLPKLTVVAVAPAPSAAANLQPPVPAGATLALAWDPSQLFVPVAAAAAAAAEPLFVAMVNQNVSAPVFAPVTVTGVGAGSVTVPAGVAGAVFACLTTFGGGLTLDELTSFGTLARPTEILIS
ncbi:hypothetical protein MBLNU459_g8227t1 [Dothideomycetes sp. NU459]